jgi:TPR repeat protein
MLMRVAAADPFPGDHPCTDLDACEKACKVGKKNTCIYGAFLALRDPNGTDRATAMYETGCKQKDAESCYHAGTLLMKGDQDAARAKKVAGYFDTACGNQHVMSCIMRGQLFVDANDSKHAVAQFKKAYAILEGRCTKKKDAAACTMLGDEYTRGRVGLDPDPKKATDFHERGCQIATKKPCPPPVEHVRLTRPPPPPPHKGRDPSEGGE